MRRLPAAYSLIRLGRRRADPLRGCGRILAAGICGEALESHDFDDAAADQYGLIRAQLRRQGTLIGGNDMMIAAIALARDLTLVTRNQAGFQRVPGLRVEHW